MAGIYRKRKSTGLLQCPGNLCGTRRARRICRFSGRIVRTAVRCLYQTDLKIKILALKEQNLSNRAIGRKLEISETKVRNILKK